MTVSDYIGEYMFNGVWEFNEDGKNFQGKTIDEFIVDLAEVLKFHENGKERILERRDLKVRLLKNVDKLMSNLLNKKLKFSEEERSDFKKPLILKSRNQKMFDMFGLDESAYKY